MLSKLKAWFVMHKVTHYIAASGAFVYTAYEKYPPFHDAVVAAYKALPSVEQHWIGLAVGMVLFYLNTKKGQQ